MRSVDKRSEGQTDRSSGDARFRSDDEGWVCGESTARRKERSTSVEERERWHRGARDEPHRQTDGGERQWIRMESPDNDGESGRRWRTANHRDAQCRSGGAAFRKRVW